MNFVIHLRFGLARKVTGVCIHKDWSMRQILPREGNEGILAGSEQVSHERLQVFDLWRALGRPLSGGWPLPLVHTKFGERRSRWCSRGGPLTPCGGKCRKGRRSASWCSRQPCCPDRRATDSHQSRRARGPSPRQRHSPSDPSRITSVVNPSRYTQHCSRSRRPRATSAVASVARGGSSC